MPQNTFSQKSSSVSELLDQVKFIINKNFDYVAVRGEVSNLSRSSQGHYYLSLSDKKSLISCVVFRGDSQRIPQIGKLVDGDVVEVVAELNLYERRGQVQLIIKKLVLVGEGDLKAKFEETKKRLFNEGLFDPARKKIIPKYPSRVAVISSQKSAAIEDFINIHNRRSLSCDLMIVPAIMQGDESSHSVMRALKKILEFEKTRKQSFDCVIICRGGGSFEDLSSFNCEQLARMVANYPKPVISAIGHQTDYTILDFIADLRAETPSAAAELLSEHEFQLRMKLDHLKVSLENKMNKFSNEVNKRLNLINPINLQNIIFKKIKKHQHYLDSINLFNRPEVSIGVYNYRQRMDEVYFKLKNVLKDNINDKKSRLKNGHDLLNALDPGQVMDRGYAMIKDNNGHIISSKKQMSSKLKIKIIQNDGESYAQVL
jgi:exodeoxyribonuclease VII large subunit